MKKTDFISGLQEELEVKTPITGSTNLKSLKEWDSMAAMILIGYVSSNMDITLTADDLKEITTVDSVIEKIGAEKFS